MTSVEELAELRQQEIEKGKAAIVENCELRKKIVGLEDENKDLKNRNGALSNAAVQISVALAQEIIDLKKECKEWEKIADLGYYKEFRAEQAKAKALEDELAKYKAFHNYFSELAGQGLQIDNWNLNDLLEPFDNFYEAAEKAMENASTKPTIDLKA